MGAAIAASGETWLPGHPFFSFAETQALTVFSRDRSAASEIFFTH
jgi:hypothetical protein